MTSIGHRENAASGPAGPAGGPGGGDTWVLLGIAAAVALLHLLTNGRYGFHRDELQVLTDARHLEWGFVPYPPFTPFVERIAMALFGLSLVGLRSFSVVAQAAVIVLAGLMARELGGGRLAQATAAAAVALSPLALFEGTEFQYTTFDYLWWVLIAYFVIRLLKTDDPRWWLAIGTVIGVGFMTKYTMAFLTAGIVTGVGLTRARRHLASGWLWAGAVLALVLFLPNLVWQVRHDFVSLHFLQHIHARDVGQGRADGFFRDQLLICSNLFAVPLWACGLAAFLRSGRYRMLAWMYLVPLALLVVGKGRGYYLGAAYPMLIAMGAVVGARWVASLSAIPRRAVQIAFLGGVVASGAAVCTVAVPLASSGPLKAFALAHNGDLREEIGWDELVETVAGIRDALPAEQRRNVVVFAQNYGEMGAMEILGAAHDLPPAISPTNSAWLRGYPTPPPTTVIVVGLPREYAEATFTACRVAGHNGNALGIVNEESRDHPDILVCGGPRLAWPELWREQRSFG